MSRIKLIKKLKEKNSKLTKYELQVIINTFSEGISNALKKGSPVEIRGFGRWSLKKIKENFNSRNPATNEIVSLKERFVPSFKVSKLLKKEVNQSLLRGF